VLTSAENTGVADVAMDPSNADILYASAYQRRRRLYPDRRRPEGAIYKSTDAGATCKQTEILVCRRKTWAASGWLFRQPIPTLCTRPSRRPMGKRIFRSTDKGSTWERRNEFDQIGQCTMRGSFRPQERRSDLVMNTFLRAPTTVAKRCARSNETNHHIDNHAIWIDPDNTRHCLVGSDGGVAEPTTTSLAGDSKPTCPRAVLRRRSG